MSKKPAATSAPSPERQLMLARLRQLENASQPLDPGANRRKKLRTAVFASSERFLRKLDSLKGYQETTDKGAGLLSAPISEHGIPLDQAIELFDTEVLKPGGNPASGAYLAYIPGGGLYHSALGDFLGAVSDKYAGVFFAGPGAVRMENMLVRWVADLIGYPASAGGHIASGGSLANLAAITTARDDRRLTAADFPKAVVYLTTQAHHSVRKALRIAGLAEAKLHYIAIDDRYRMRSDALAQAIGEDRAQGLTPWLVIGAGGTTDTGAVDPLDAIATIAERERCWFHVDAAYGGFFMLTETGREMFKGIERSNSAILDPHKSLFLPWGSGMLLVRDVMPLAKAHGYSGNYMQDAIAAAGEMSPSETSPELTKPFRALRMWLPLILLGVKPFRAALEEKLLLARYFYEEVQTLGFEVGPMPDLSIVTFRWAPAGASLEQTNEWNRAIVDGARKDGRIFISSTTLDDRFTIRMAVLGFRTHKRTIDLALRVLREQVAALT
jgi:aromatic-L-amino-acid/L-tryptophan decarboxylase